MSLFGGVANPYDDIVVKTTDENLTSENWELIINLVDKVTEEGEQGARNVIASILKRLAHRNPNVQLYSLSLAEALSKNCGKELHAEIASRAFTQGLEKLITDRTTHDKVRRKALQLIGMWTQEWESDPTLGLMEECYKSLRAKNYSFNAPDEPPPPEVDDEVRRREEEELQRALEISMTDKGGRQQWAQYSLTAASSSGPSGSSPGPSGSSASASSSSAVPAEPARNYSGGYIPNAESSTQSYAQPQPASPTVPVSVAPSSATTTAATPAPALSMSGLVTRVRALHTFEPSEAGELAFDRGDVIKVVDRGYKDWWRGQLKGRTGIFPVNYVEPLPEPTAEELAAEAQAESNVFAQAANVDRLLAMLRQMDPAKDNLADNEEIQELYRSSMALRPKIVKLIDKYSQKRADLVAMNESFVKARTIFDRMMEESLARHSGYYDQRPPYGPPQPSYRPDSRAYGDPAAYAGYEQPPYAYGPGPANAYSPPTDQYGPAYGPGPQPPYAQPHGYAAPPHGYAPVSPALGQDPYAQQQLQQPPQQSPQQQPAQQQPVVQHQHQQQQPQPQPQPQQQQPDAHQQQPDVQPGAHQQQQQQQHQAQAQQQAPMQGPPYVFDPSATYPDPNAQAWAQYYAAGGDDPTGAVYFHSVPGIKPPAGVTAAGSPTQAQAQSQGAYGQQAQGMHQAQSSQVSLTSSTSSAGAHEHPQQHPANASFVQAIQQQQQQQQQHQPDPRPQSVLPDPRGPIQQVPLPDPRAPLDPALSRHNSIASLPDPYENAGAEGRQGSLPNPYAQAQVPYGQSPYPPQGQQGQGQQDVYGMQAQFAGMQVGEGQQAHV